MLSSPIAWIGNALTHYTGLWSRAFVTPATLKRVSIVHRRKRNATNSSRPNLGHLRQGVLHGSKRLGIRSSVCVGHRILAMTLPIAAVALATWQRLRQTCPDGRLVVAAVGALAVHSHLLFRRTVRGDGRPLRRLRWRPLWQYQARYSPYGHLTVSPSRGRSPPFAGRRQASATARESSTGSI